MACVPPQELVGFGAMLQFYDELSASWQTVGGTSDLSFADEVLEAIETTSNDSDGGAATRIPSPLTSLEPQEYEFNFRWSEFSQVQSIFSQRRILDWRIVLMNPQQSYQQFCAFISKVGGTIPMRELVKAMVELTPTGSSTWGQLIS